MKPFEAFSGLTPEPGDIGRQLSRRSGRTVTPHGLRDYFATSNFKPDSVVVNHQLPAGGILVFRGSDVQNRTVLLILGGAAASARPEEKKARKMPPLSLELSYIEDAAHPGIFKISKGQF